MNAIRTYEYLTLARGRIFEWTAPLAPDQYTRAFAIGLGSIARNLTHVMICEDMYVRRIRGETVPPYDQWPFQDERPPPFATLVAHWKAQAAQTRASLANVQDWTTELEYISTTQEGERFVINASRSDIFTQLALHEVHHRAQVMNMLRQLGVQAEDIDFNTMMYKRRPA